MMLDPRTDKERLEAPAQWGHAYVKFKNDNGVPEIRVGVKEFKCIGVSPPQDHPHIYLVMGNDDTLLCPYCATLFRFDPRLGPDEAEPPDCLFIDKLGVTRQALRGGIHFISYLQTGHYYGMDINQLFLDAGYEREVVPAGLSNRLHLICEGNIVACI